MTRTYPRLADLLDDLAGPGAWRIEPMDKHVDSLSGAPFEYAYVGTERYVVKHIAHHTDWLMRALHDGADGRRPRALVVWQEGLLARLPAAIDHVIVAMAYDPATGELSQVMREIATTLVPPGSDRIELSRHRGFLEHMAAMHATFWGFTDTYGLASHQDRYGFAHPSVSEAEAAAGHTDPIPRLFPGGWAAVRAIEPRAADTALALAADVTPLARAMADGPQTLVHGDWKFGNLGTHPDGRTVLLDWAWPGQANPCVDLAWYLAVNCDRLPESKEDTIAAYREGLHRQGIDTRDWWDRQLDLALLGGFLQLGWSKSGDELSWWIERVLRTALSLRPTRKRP